MKEIPDIRDEDSGLEPHIGLTVILLVSAFLYASMPLIRLLIAIVLTVLIVYLTFKRKRLRGFKIIMYGLLLAVLWSIYLNLIPY